MKFGIDLGGSHVAIGMVDENSEIIEKRTYYMNDRRNVSLEDYIVSSIVHGVNEILQSTKYNLCQIESIGIARTEQALQKADIVLFISDARQAMNPSVAIHMEQLPPEKIVLVHNKSDLLSGQSDSFSSLSSSMPVPVAIEVWISALEKKGIETLEEKLYTHLSSHSLHAQDISVNDRHKVCLLRAAESLQRSKDTLEQGLPLDFVSIDLKEAIVAFGEIIGESVSEEVIHEVFHRFCVGK